MGTTASHLRKPGKKVSSAEIAREQEQHEKDEMSRVEVQISPKSQKYNRVTHKAGEIFGLGETPVLIKENRKTETSVQSRSKDHHTRAAKVGVNLKPSADNLIPTMFKWKLPASARRATVCGDPHVRNNTKKEGQWRPKEVMVGGSFSNWELIRMKPSRNGFAIIVDLPVGEHQYKFKIDGEWMHHPFEPTINDGVGGLNNVIKVTEADAEVFRALDVDAQETERRNSKRRKYPVPLSTDYSQHLPFTTYSELETYLRHGGPPPVLPPHLLEVILNKDTPLCCEPTLLPSPGHVMVNHMYALSLKDDVIVMSATQRYKKKCVTTVLYKPVGDETAESGEPVEKEAGESENNKDE